MKKPTSQDVARLAGVSQTTVSLILNNSPKNTFSPETRARVMEAAAQLNYTLTPRKDRKPHNGGDRLLMVLTPTLMNQYYADLVSHLEEYAETRDYRVIVCNTFRKPELEKSYLDTFAGRSAAGIIYTFLPAHPREAERLNTSIPTVIIGEKQEDLAISSIELSNEKAGALLAQHLIGLGHRHLAFLSTPLNQLTMARTQRLAGIRNQLAAAGIQDGLEVLTPERSDEPDRDGSMPYEYALGSRLTCQLIQSHSAATALIGVNDMTALGILHGLAAQKLSAPRDYSVCGFDNIFSARTVLPGLTTIDHHLRVRCKAAVDMVISRLEPGDGTEPMVNKIEYAPQLVVRGSTGAVRRSS